MQAKVKTSQHTSSCVASGRESEGSMKRYLRDLESTEDAIRQASLEFNGFILML